jgi:hypothetical protein
MTQRESQRSELIRGHLLIEQLSHAAVWFVLIRLGTRVRRDVTTDRDVPAPSGNDVHRPVDVDQGLHQPWLVWISGLVGDNQGAIIALKHVHDGLAGPGVLPVGG